MFAKAVGRGLLLSLVFSLPMVSSPARAACKGEGSVCGGILGSCCDGLSCIVAICVDTSSCRADGETCTSDSQCCSGLGCSTLLTCEPEAGAGETCGPAVPCADPLVCDLSTDGFTFRCRHDPPTFGEACSVFVPCDDGLACTSLTTQRCVHSPARDGEFCDAAAPCGEGLFCEPGSQKCEPERGIGDYCDLIVDKCAPGLVCLPCSQVAVEGCRGNGACWPNLDIDRQAFTEQECLDIYAPVLHQGWMTVPPANGSQVVTYGTGRQIVGVFGATEEIGAAYGINGQYGCYKTTCFGLETDLELSAYTAITNYTTYAKVAGPSQAAVIEAGDFLNYSLVRISDTDQDPVFGELNGLEEAWSLGISGSPIPASIGAYLCQTDLTTVVGNTPPSARCADAQACADGVTCNVVAASIDAGSDDPDGDAITVDQSPAGPYDIGSHTLTLTVTDTSGDSDSCSATLDVLDCTPPDITCPAPVTAECAANGATTLDPGDASATDCSAVTVSDPGTASYPLGTTAVDYSAVDAFGNEATCQTPVTVVDTIPPAIDSVTASPNRLWPPNHTLHTIAVGIAASDACDPDVRCAVVSVDSNEPDSGLDEDDLPGDTQIVDSHTVLVRSERGGEGSGRTYTITVECSDSTGGGATQGTTEVFVPHDQAS